MSDFNKQRGGQETSGGGFFLKNWWNSYRAWVAGLDRAGRIRYRVLQVLAVLAILLIAGALYLRSWIRLPSVPDVPPQPGGPSHSAGADSGSVQSRPDVEYEGAELPEVARSGRREGYYTFLVCGQDAVSGATDTMLLFTYDTKLQRVNAISLLRDTMINTKASSKRLNTVYARNRGARDLPYEERVENGMAALRQEVSKLTGIYPDFYVLVQWEAIGRLVDAIGGVEFEVPFDMDYDDDTPGQDLHIHQKAGLRLLDGQDAMEVIRFRRNNDDTRVLGDGGRTQIQRDFLAAVLKKCLTPEILLKLPALVQIFIDNVDTDLTVGNILAFAQLAAGMDTENNVKFVSMPFDNVAYGRASMVVTREDELLELLNDGLNPYVDDIKSSDLQLIYKKAGGGYGVTNAELADPAMGRAPSKPKEKPEEPQEEPPAQEEPRESEENPGGLAPISPEDVFPGYPSQSGDEPEGQDTQAAA